MLSIKNSTKRKTESSIETFTIDTPNKDESNSMNAEEIRYILLPRIRNALNQGQNDEAIQISNTYIDDLKDEHLLIITIKLQMKAWRNKRDLVEQLKLSETLMRLAPEDPEGYINTAEVYSVRGQQNNVMDIVGKGLKNVSKDLHGDEYEKLSRQYHEAGTRISNRIDFLNQLPYDIACVVPEYLPLGSLAECLRVSRSWQGQIINNTIIWRTFTIDSLNDSRVSLLRLVTPHVENLCFGPIDREIECYSIFIKFVQALRSSKFPRLRRLFICSGLWDDDEYHHLLSDDMSETVTDLIFEQNEILLSYILMKFRNLTSLRYCIGPTSSGERFSIPVLPYTTSLQTLYLDTQSYRRIKTSQLKNLFERSPHLRSITLLHVEDKVLPIICQCCPNVTILKLNNPIASIEVNDTGLQISKNTTGLQYMSLYSLSNTNYVRQLLETHWNTIRTLNLCDIILTNMEPFLTVSLPHVKELHLETSFGLLSEQQILSLLQHCPSVQTLSLAGLTPQTITNNIFVAIGLMQHLDTLFIRDYDISADEDVLIRSFQKLIHLKSIIMDGNSGTAPILFSAAVHIPNLESVFVIGSESLSKEQFRTFISKLSKLKYLRTVKFCGILMDILGILKEFQNSKSVESMESINTQRLNNCQARKILPKHISLSFKNDN